MTEHHHPLRHRLLAGAAGVIALSLLGAPTASADAPVPSVPLGTVNNSLGFAVRPLAQPGAQQRGAFSYTLEPGQNLQDIVAVINGTKEAKTFYIYAADATNTSVGGSVALSLRDAKLHDAGAWIQLAAGSDKLVLPPEHAAEIGFTVSVPRDAEPGDHTGGIVAEEVTPSAVPTKGAGINVINRIGTALYVRVAGPTHASLQLLRMSVTHHDPLVPFVGSSSDSVTFTVANTGNIRIQPDEVKVVITGLFGHKVKTFVLDRPPPGAAAQQARALLPEEILPGNEVQFGRRWHGIPPLDVLTAHLTVQGEDAALHGPVSVSRSLRLWVVPWLAIAVLVAAVAAWLAWRAWRRRRPRAVSSPAPEPSPGGPDGPTATEPDDGLAPAGDVRVET